MPARGQCLACGSGGGTVFQDNTFLIQDDLDLTKQIDFDLSGITTGNTRTLSVPDKDIDLPELMQPRQSRCW